MLRFLLFSAFIALISAHQCAHYSNFDRLPITVPQLITPRVFVINKHNNNNNSNNNGKYAMKNNSKDNIISNNKDNGLSINNKINGFANDYDNKIENRNAVSYNNNNNDDDNNDNNDNNDININNKNKNNNNNNKNKNGKENENFAERGKFGEIFSEKISEKKSRGNREIGRRSFAEFFPENSGKNLLRELPKIRSAKMMMKKNVNNANVENNHQSGININNGMDIIDHKDDNNVNDNGNGIKNDDDQRYRNDQIVNINSNDIAEQKPADSALGGAEPLRIVVRHLWDTDPQGDPFMCHTVEDTVVSTYKPTVRVSCTVDNLINDSRKKNKLKSDISKAVEFLSKVLKLHQRIDGNLRISDEDCTPASSFAGMIPLSDFQDGIPDADVVLYITARPAPKGVSAFASRCQVDQNGRATVGHVNWDPAAVDPSQIEDSSTSFAKHVILHAFGFSASGFASFRDPLRPSRVLPHSSVVRTVKREINGVSHEVKMLVTPTVVEVARRHFACLQIEGVELEDGGGESIAGSHWDKRIFDNEVMTGSVGPHAIATALTFAAMQDSTWYAVDFSAVEGEVEFGRHRGCAFATGSCSDWPSDLTCKDSQPADLQPPRCTRDARFKAHCGMAEGVSNIPPQFRYFDTPGLGGTNELRDYCPVVEPSPGGNCEDPRNRNVDLSDLRGEIFAPGSRCFVSDIVKSGNDIGPATGCYSASCSPDGKAIKVTIAGGSTLTCESNAQVINAPNGFEGRLICPDDIGAVCGVKQDNSPALDWPRAVYVSPPSGRNGTVLTIRGENFKTTHTVTLEMFKNGVDVNRYTCDNSLGEEGTHNPTVITCRLPRTRSGPMRIIVTDPDSSFSTSLPASAFEVEIDSTGLPPDYSSPTPSPDNNNNNNNNNGGGSNGRDESPAIEDEDDGETTLFEASCGGTPCWIMWGIPPVLVGIGLVFWVRRWSRRKDDDDDQDDRGGSSSIHGINRNSRRNNNNSNNSSNSSNSNSNYIGNNGGRRNNNRSNRANFNGSPGDGSNSNFTCTSDIEAGSDIDKEIQFGSSIDASLSSVSSTLSMVSAVEDIELKLISSVNSISKKSIDTIAEESQEE